MLMKSLSTLVLALFTTLSMAAVDANKADLAALDSVKGIGPALSAKIVAERKAGAFKDWPDLMQRVVGIGPKSAVRLSEGGLTVNGSTFGSKPDARAAGSTTAAAPRQAAAQPGTTTTASNRSAAAEPRR